MTHFRRRRPRASSGSKKGRGYWMNCWPAWWDRVFHTRPKRVQTHALERKALHEDPDGVAWPLGNHKPHRYFW